ncbi:MAG: S-adenosylmethionine:tRNA ribosyltransferase-isomerase, partial [Patescibacteria group bacterium]
VGLGTFAPVTDEQLRQGALHSERYRIDAATARRLNAAKRQGRLIIAVGTTVVRTLETAAHGRASLGRAASRRHSLRAASGTTDLFIRPGYRFKFIDGMITNFHVPRSSLMMLVAAFVSREELLALYQKATRKKFRFFSFGDGMLLSA